MMRMSRGGLGPGDERELEGRLQFHQGVRSSDDEGSLRPDREHRLHRRRGRQRRPRANYAASKGGPDRDDEVGGRASSPRATSPPTPVAPGFIKTRMTDAIPEEAKKKLFDKILLGRMGEPREVAQAVLFLSSGRVVVHHRATWLERERRADTCRKRRFQGERPSWLMRTSRTAVKQIIVEPAGRGRR